MRRDCTMTDDPDGANSLADGQASQAPLETELTKKELIESVTDRSGVAQGEVRQVVQARPRSSATPSMPSGR